MTKKFREIILHAGLPKTGSTSIQNNCFQHRDALMEQGIHYPAFSLNGRRLLNHSDPLTAVLFSTSNKRQWAYRQGVMESQSEARQQFSKQFDELFQNSGAEKLLLSAEIVANYNDRDLKALRKYLQKHTDNLRVIVFVRSPQSSLESILQQQAYGGGVEDNVEGAVGLVRERFEVLHKHFGGAMEVLDFHKAIDQPGGLVGEFLRALPIDQQLIDRLEFSSSNERVSIEAYKLMVAINQRYPVSASGKAAYQRRFHDLKPLSDLPGQPFRIDSFKDSSWYEAVCREGALLEKKYGFDFPELVEKASQPLWQQETLLRLEDALCRLESFELRDAAASHLEEEAQRVDSPETAAVLRFVSQRIKATQNEPMLYLLDQLGADYFKFAALQLGKESPALALSLMSLAQKLRPDAKFINEQVELLRSKAASK
jgi:hypothetical protein